MSFSDRFGAGDLVGELDIRGLIGMCDLAEKNAVAALNLSLIK
jgi:hypothetical protein